MKTQAKLNAVLLDVLIYFSTNISIDNYKENWPETAIDVFVFSNRIIINRSSIIITIVCIKR